MRHTHPEPSPFSLRRNLRHLFVRPPSHVPMFDAIRGFGILWITACHAIWLAPYVLNQKLRAEDLPFFARFVNHADLGVDTFFVLSGLLIGQMLLTTLNDGSRVQFGKFYLGRAFRILPVYCLSLALWVAIGGPNRNMLWSNVLFVNNFVTLPRQVLPTAWSLAIEEQFYLVMPLLTVLLLRLSRARGLALLCAMLALSLLVRWAVVVESGLPRLELHDYMVTPPPMDIMYAYHDTLYDKLHVRFGCLILGVLAAYLHVRYPEELRRLFARRYTVPALLALSAAATAYVFGPGQTTMYVVTFRTLFGTVAAALLLISLYSDLLPARLIRAVLSLRFWYPLAQLSYAAYLLQLMVISAYYGALAGRTSMPLPRLVMLSIAPICALVLGFALLAYLGVERPFLNLRRSLEKRAAVAGSSLAAVTMAERTGD